MKKQIILLLLFVALTIGQIVILGLANKKEVEIDEEIIIKPTLSHEQMVWTYALEWCESRGVMTAINPNDLDNTPSYYSYQWKPGTFKYYGEKYGVIEKGKTEEEIMELMKDYELQRQILTAMVLDGKNIKWEKQFPWCVKKLGRPPLK